MFGDLDWPLNASREFVSISWASCLTNYRLRYWTACLQTAVTCENTLFRYPEKFQSKVNNRVVRYEMLLDARIIGLLYAKDFEHW